MAPAPLARPDIDSDVIELGPELWFAIKAGRRLDLPKKLGISPTLATIVGCAYVEFRATRHACFYQPDAGGVPVLIVGVTQSEAPEPGAVIAVDLATGISLEEFEPGGSVIVDLVAIEVEGVQVATRLGWAAVLGEAAIQAARERPLKLLSPRQWVREPDDAAAIIDWRRAPYLLQDCGGIECSSLSLARRVRRAFDQPLGMPPLSVIIEEPALEPAL